MTKEEALKLAKESGMCGEHVTADRVTDEELAFANACEKIGMEKAETICMGIYSMPWHDEHGCSKNRSAAIDCSKAIRAHKE